MSPGFARSAPTSLVGARGQNNLATIFGSGEQRPGDGVKLSHCINVREKTGLGIIVLSDEDE
jgi:pantoate kinase